MKKLVTLLFFLVSSLGFSQNIEWDPKTTFEAVFDIDAVHTTDGINYELSASGDAGPYGKAYISYVFTNYNNSDTNGEFTGFAWTQMGEKIVKATLQGVIKKEGKVFKMYSYDNTTDDNKIMIVSGIVDFVEQTIKFKVSPLK
ncbi:hypothetical protein N9K80_04465 [Flavobacteriaceae bacterium]|jgi:hypothetical protein|nr:hypothetical protein [Flavobacteriaceae bacterium]